MSAKGHLKRAFLAALAAAPIAMAAPPPTSQGRTLTAGENSMIAIFGKEVNPAVVKLHAGPRKGTTAGEAFDPKTIAVYGHPYLSLDYSQEKDPFNFGLFFHETTHTWQFQTGWIYTKGHCPGGYQYRLQENSRFGDFCSESQGAIVEDYARRYLKPQSASSNWYVSMCGYDTPEHDAMLLKTVEGRFPQAREMRLKLGRGETLPDAKKRPADAPACPRADEDTTPKGRPVYFCETLAYVFSQIKGIAFTERLPAWPGFEAALDKKAPVCTVSIWGSGIMNISGKDFGANGQINPDKLGALAQELVKYTPQGMLDPVHRNLAGLFDNLVDKQKAEKKALKAIPSKETAQKILQTLEMQLKDDPSLPPNSRGFVEEKIKIVKESIAKFGRPETPPDGGKKPDVRKSGDRKGTGAGPDRVLPDGDQPVDKKPVQPPPEKKPEKIAPLDPDKNIKDVLDSAFGGKTTGPAKPASGPKATS